MPEADQPAATPPSAGEPGAYISEARYRSIMDTALDAVLVMDHGGKIVEWNPAAERIFGWTRAEVLGLDLAAHIIPERLRAAHYRGLARYMESGEGPVLGARLELPAVRRGGEEFPVELNISPLPGADPRLFVGFIRDISERKTAEDTLRASKERAEVASRAKDNFLAALSHELRTPLTPVLMIAAALREDPRLPHDMRGQLDMIERNIGLEARLIDDLLDLTRIARGKFQLREELCDAHSLIGLAAEIVREEALAKPISLELRLEAKLSGLHGDPARLQQVFWNLLRNAIKFTPGGGHVLIRTTDDAARARLRVEVSDSGIGLSPDSVDTIFQPFEQAGRENDHRFGGLGLGLAIVRAIVDLHGGTIQATSPGLDQGTTFVVELPGAIDPPSGITAQLAASSEQATLPEQPLRLLLVEDHEATLQVLERLLRREGHTVVIARTVACAAEIGAGQAFDGVISDLGLPDGTGFDLMEKLRAQHPSLCGIALSGYGMEEDQRRSREAGFLTHLVKPIAFDQLRRALRGFHGA